MLNPNFTLLSLSYYVHLMLSYEYKVTKYIEISKSYGVIGCTDSEFDIVNDIQYIMDVVISLGA